jgi:Carboxypeptidase regulatory-like domain
MGIVRSWARAGVVLLIGLANVATTYGQGSTGTIAGTVVDASGAAIPGATVTATEANTGTSRTTTSNDSGVFTMPSLNPGRYSLRIELSGFKPVTIADVSVGALETRDLGALKLEVGAYDEVITVASEVTPVQTTDSSRRATITGDDIANIQTKGRDIFGMMGILPGVQDTNLNRDFAQWRSAISITINGMPSQNKDVRVDGINVVDEGGCGTAYVNLNMDAVGEVQVIANGYTAENGRNNGGLISIVTKSGTSQLKGSGWYAGRRDRFNSNDYFRSSTNVAKPLYRINISGYAVGGPVVIPGLLDSRGSTGGKKMYFFGSQEYTDDARPTTLSRANMPTELEKRGDFSQTRITNGTIQPIIDPQTGQPFPGNVIPPGRINQLGQKMLNLLPTANGILNSAPGQEWTSNSLYDLTPVHGRTNHVLRVDTVWSDKTRFNGKIIVDRDEDGTWNRITPGTGFVNQTTPGLLLSTTVTKVISSTVVNETNFGYTHNRWGFLYADDFDATSLYRSTLGIDPPRFEPLGSYTDPPEVNGIGKQVDEWPYVPRFSTTGGNRTNLANYRVANGTIQSGDEPVPRLNLSGRFTFSNDTTMSMGTHTVKAGLYLEYNRKTEPGTPDYMGNFNFGHSPDNPLSTGNGYANMLLGVFTTYTEASARVDRDVRHWQNDFYLQDNWRITPRLTIDYGLRVQHSGSDFELNEMNSGFFADAWSASQAARVYRSVCSDGRPGTQACPANMQFAMDPARPGVFFPLPFAGNIVQGSGSQLNGIKTGGIEGRKPGTYFTFPYFTYAPRVGFAWNVFGDGKTAVRGSWGIFYNFPRSTGDGGYPFAAAVCPISCANQIRWGTFDDISRATASNLVQNPVNVNIADYDQPLAKSQNVNIAFQKDIGFKTVAEVAYVGNFTRSGGRLVDANRLPVYVYGDPNNLVNNAPVNANALRAVYGRYPGMGTAMEFVPNLYNEVLRYNALQTQLARRFSNGLQMSFAYTLAKGEGFQSYDPYTDQLGGEDAIRARYWGPTQDDRRHNMTITYSYDIPSFMKTPFVKQLLQDWQVSGVTRLLSGQALTPSCTSTNPGINNTNPSLTDGPFWLATDLTGGQPTSRRCELTGEPINLKHNSNPDEPHFNLNAFRMPQPNGNVGSFGNEPVGILRQPTWHSFDLTLSRVFKLPVGAHRDTRVKLQVQAYNLFNEVQFTNMNTVFQFTGPNNSVLNSTTTGRYVATGDGLAAGTIAPRVIALSIRADF